MGVTRRSLVHTLGHGNEASPLPGSGTIGQDLLIVALTKIQKGAKQLLIL
jgi:hypothetical protein